VPPSTTAATHYNPSSSYTCKLTYSLWAYGESKQKFEEFKL
jgi:hypothetical protein